MGKQSLPKDDESLWADFLAGEVEALAALSFRHSRRLYWYMLLSTGRPEEALRHLFRTWELVASYRQPLEGFGSFYSWLYAVATQNATPAGLPEEFGIADLLDDLWGRSPGFHANPLAASVRELPRKLRQPFLLATLAGLSITEAAKACRFSPERTSQLVERAGECMRRALAPTGDATPAASRLADEGWLNQAMPAPPKLEDLVAEHVRKAAAHWKPMGRSPANPRPEHSPAQKAFILGLTAAAVAALTAALLWASSRTYVPPPIAGQIAWHAGTVHVSDIGGMWRLLQPGERALPEGTAVRTGPDGLLRIASESAEWRADANTSAVVRSSRRLELAEGRIFVCCEAAAGDAIQLFSPGGAVTCTAGSFTAFATPMRLRVACVSGQVQLGPDVVLQAGQTAQLEQGVVRGPIRPINVTDATHWLCAFQETTAKGLVARQRAVVPLVPQRLAMPDDIVVEELSLVVNLKGALAIVRAEAILKNTSSVPGSCELPLCEALLPSPLAYASLGRVALEAGGTASWVAFALCALQSRAGHYGLGLNVGALTGRPIERVLLRAEAEADGGVAGLSCTGLEPSSAQVTGRPNSWQGVNVSPASPIVLEAQLQERSGTDAVALRWGADCMVLIAWRPGAPERPWFHRGRKLFFAFDATADFGDAGRAYAQEVLENIVGAVPRGQLTALMAYDGIMKADVTGFGRHLPGRAEAMLGAIWAVKEGLGNTTSFLRDVLAVAEREGTCDVVFVTGRTIKSAQGDLPAVPDGVRLMVVRIGADLSESRWGLPSNSASVVIGRPLAPESGACDLLWALQWPLWERLECKIRGAGRVAVARHWLRSAGQPVLAVVQGARPGAALRGDFRGEAGGRVLGTDFDLTPEVAELPTWAAADLAMQVEKCVEAYGLLPSGMAASVQPGS